MDTRVMWDAGIEQELGWWRRYLETGGLDRPDEFRFRFDPLAPLQPHVAALLPVDRPPEQIRLLDCAAGPVTTLGKTLGEHPLALTAVDALADRYAIVLAALDLHPPVPSISCRVEELDSRFVAGEFDLVYMRFALDHVIDPIAALRQMVRVARPGGTVLIEHYRDNEQTGLAGLRQWYLEPAHGDLIIRNPGARHSVRDEIADVQIRVCADDDWLTMTLRKPVSRGE